jgi:hypothetical protein
MDINKVLRLLRNEGAFTTRQEALEHIEAVSAERQDGEMWIASYNDNDVIKTLIAVKRDGENGVTVFDNDGNTEKIETLITEEIEKLDVPYGLETNAQYVFNVAEIDGKIEKRIGVISPKNKSPLTIEFGENGMDKIFDINVDGTTIQKEIFSSDPVQVQLQVGTIPASSVNVDRDTTLVDKLGEIDDSIGSISGEIEGNLKSYKIVSIENPVGTSQAEYKIQEKVGDGNWNDVRDSATIVVPKDIDTAITNAITELDATVGSQTVESGKHIAVEVVEEDGLLRAVTVTEDDIASASRLEEVERVTAEALNDLEMRKITLEDLPDFVTNVNGGNGISVSENGQSKTVSVDLDTDSTNALSFNDGKLYCSNNPSINCGTY